MTRLTRLLCLSCFLLSIPLELGSQDRAHDLAGKAAAQHPARCPNSGMTLQICHDKFPDGCSASRRPSYDAYLYFAEDTAKGIPGKPAVSETCNCKLTAPDTFDYHLGLGFNSTLAASAR